MQFLIFVAIVLFLGTFLYAKKSVLSKRNKGILVGLILLSLLLGTLYEWNASEQSAHNRDVINAYKQGKTLMCDEKEISNKTFLFVSGTLSFIPNDSNKNDKGVVIDIQKCSIK